jgi:ElaB/YqjD/DUF883 family membrane-anchored ribosome-binding protein
VEPIYASKNWVFLALNILTLGIYGSAEKLAKEHRVAELKVEGQKLREQAGVLKGEWNRLEKELEALLESQSSQSAFSVKTLKSRLTKLDGEIEQLASREVHLDYHMAATVGGVALGTIEFIGQLIANVLTIGLWGAYQYHSLSNKIAVEKALNQHFCDEVIADQGHRFDLMKKTIEMAQGHFTLQEDYSAMSKTDQGKAFQAQQKAEKDLADLQADQKKLMRDMAALRAQKVSAEQVRAKTAQDLGVAQKEVRDLKDINSDLQRQKLQDNRARDQLQAQIDAKQQEIARKQQEIAGLYQAQSDLRLKANQVAQLQRDLDLYKNAQKYQSDAQKLCPKLGPIPPKYTPPAGHVAERKGAMDVDLDKVDATAPDYDQEWIDFVTGYNGRYGDDKRTEPEIFEASFNFACKELFKLAGVMDQNGDVIDEDDRIEDAKIKLNNSFNTINHPNSAQVVFRFMAMDLLKGAKVVDNGCHGFKLQINGHITMLPSLPEKVMQFKNDQKGGLQPVVIVHHGQRDGFTPSVEAIGQNGVDPVSAKWILDELDEEEQEHLFNLLMSPVIENDHDELVETKAFMSNSADPRVQLVQTAYDLIADLGIAYQKNFGTNLVPKVWGENFDDFVIEPFFKAEDDMTEAAKIQDDLLIEDPNGKMVEWTFDLDVIGDKRKGDVGQRQSDFVDLLTFAKMRYKTVFDHLYDGKDILEKPLPIGTEYKKLEFNDLTQQYIICHQMIGADQFANGGQRCLFSNLLAVIMTDKNDLTDLNVVYMKNAMANYLEKLLDAEASAKNAVDILDDEDDKTKELAVLASSFRKAIQSTHKCTLEAYILWLRGEVSMFRNGWHYAAQINASSLTEVEIQLCAFALGVRIGVFAIQQKISSVVNDEGLIVPEGQWYGPKTKEFLLIGSTGGSFYGLFPKLKKPTQSLYSNFDDLDNAEIVSAYWRKIDMNKT